VGRSLRIVRRNMFMRRDTVKVAFDGTCGLAYIRAQAVDSIPVILRNDGATRVMNSLLWLVSTVIELYVWCLIISAVLSWLVAFKVVNTQNRFVYLVGDFLHRVTDPVLRPIRRFLPNLAGIDLAPIVLILLLFFVRNLLFEYMPM
jgi:YggT family protein